jgi:hypothetical protein
VRVAAFLGDAEGQMRPLPRGNVQRAEQPVPDGQKTAEIAVVVRRVDRMVHLVVRRAQHQPPGPALQRDPEFRVLQLRQHQQAGDDDDIAAGKREHRHRPAGQVDEPAMQHAHAGRHHVEKDQRVDRMDPEHGQRRQRLRGMVGLMEFPQERDFVLAIMVGIIAELVAEEDGHRQPGAQ